MRHRSRHLNPQTTRHSRNIASADREQPDWPALLPDIARMLLGEPPRIEAGGDTWRYNTHGSLAVHVGGEACGTWHLFDGGKSGGVLGLVEHVNGCDKAGALRWLVDNRLIPPTSGAAAPAARRPAPPPKPPATLAPAPKPSRTAPVAAAIIAASVPADDTPARVYLASRWTWPPTGIGPNLPAAVRWCPARAVPDRAGLPAEAAGAVVFVLRRYDVQEDETPAVSLEALTTGGRPLVPRWRRTFGTRTGRVLDVPVAAGGAVVLVEGETDALAVALTLRAGAVRSVGGTAGYRPAAAADDDARPVVLLPDADHAGAAAVTRLLADLPGRVVRLAWPLPPTGDPSAWLAAWLSERAGIREYDNGGMTRRKADRAAWCDLFRAVERGDTILCDPEAP